MSNENEATARPSNENDAPVFYYHGQDTSDIDKKRYTSVVVEDGCKEIKSWAFFQWENLVSATIPDSVTSIEEYAFTSCAGLTSITIGKGVVSIEESAFNGCSSLTSVIIPDSVADIGNFAFCDCSGLTSVIIPNSVTKIGDGAFSACSGLTSITVAEGNPVYHSAGNCLIKTASKTLVAGCKTSEIPSDDSVTSIGNYAFSSRSGLNSVIIPDGVTSIGEYAFGGCSELTSVTIPASVKKIDFLAFNDSNLQEAIFLAPRGWKAGVMAHPRLFPKHPRLSDPAEAANLLAAKYSNRIWTHK